MLCCLMGSHVCILRSKQHAALLYRVGSTPALQAARRIVVFCGVPRLRTAPQAALLYRVGSHASLLHPKQHAALSFMESHACVLRLKQHSALFYRVGSHACVLRPKQHL